MPYARAKLDISVDEIERLGRDLGVVVIFSSRGLAKQSGEAPYGDRRSCQKTKAHSVKGVSGSGASQLFVWLLSTAPCLLHFFVIRLAASLDCAPAEAPSLAVLFIVDLFHPVNILTNNEPARSVDPR